MLILCLFSTKTQRNFNILKSVLPLKHFGMDFRFPCNKRFTRAQYDGAEFSRVAIKTGLYTYTPWHDS